MSNPKNNEDNVTIDSTHQPPPQVDEKDSKNQLQGDIVEDSTNAQPREAVDSTSLTPQDAATNAPPLPPSPTTSAPPSPRPSRPMHRTSGSQSAPPAPYPRLPPPPPPPMPYGPFMMPAGHVPAPFCNPPMMMPPPNFQFSPYPYGQPFIPYGYTMIPYPPNPWATGPFDCFSDAKNCCLTCCCPCVTFGQITEILNEGQTPWWEHAMCYLAMESITLSVGTFLYAWPYRVKMRTKFWLRGKLLWDFLFTFFCTRVSLCQQYRQLSRMGFDVPLGWEANREKITRLKAQGNMYQMQNRQVIPPAIELGMYR